MADDAVQKALAQIAEFDARSNRLKRWVNDYDTIEGNEPRFANVGDGSTFVMEGVNKPKGRQFSPGQFFNKPFAGAVKLIMIGRFEANGNQPSPASVDEIHDALMQGSFSFETSGADAQKNSIKISLGKNSSTFVRLPGSELFGLLEWYGKKPKAGRKASPTSAEAAGFGADDDENYFTAESQQDLDETATDEKPAAAP